MNINVLLPAAVAVVAVFSLAAIFPAVLADHHEDDPMPLTGDNETSLNMTDTTSISSTASLILDNGTLDCQAIASEFGGIGIPSGNVCDVVVVRQTPQITGDNGLNLNQFTLMNSVLEFYVMPTNTSTTVSSNSTIMSDSSTSSTNDSSIFTSDNTTSLGNSSSMGSNTTTSGTEQVYVMGDFALLETEMNDVLTIVKDNGWTVTGIHNHMINETPKTSFMHWEAMGDINEIVDQANQAFAETSIKG